MEASKKSGVHAPCCFVRKLLNSLVKAERQMKFWGSEGHSLACGEQAEFFLFMVQMRFFDIKSQFRRQLKQTNMAEIV